MNAGLDIVRRNRQFLTYCVMGGSGVAIDFLVYSLLVWSGLIGYQQANAIGYLAGTVLSFALNARYNFRVSDRLLMRFAAFVSVAIVGFASSAWLLWILVARAGVGEYAAKIASLVVVVLIQYNLNRLISFRQVA